MDNQKDNKIKFCKSCNKKTNHILCGFGTPNSFVGNARYECIECRKQTNKPTKQNEETNKRN